MTEKSLQEAKLKIFGNDYPTKDGTGVRDYIHIDDLVKGHLTTLDALFNSNLSKKVPDLVGSDEIVDHLVVSVEFDITNETG